MGLNIIVTAGPTNERIDSVMKITNMSTGSLGAAVADTLLNDAALLPHIDRLYYISPKLARKPSIDDTRIVCIEIESAEDLKEVLEDLLTNNKIDIVVHSAAVGDYKARYSARAESVAKEIAETIMELGSDISIENMEKAALGVLKNPACVSDDSGKMSSYEPNLMTMMDLTPKVIGTIKKTSPDTLLIGFKLLDGVSKEELFQVASRLREKNDADYIIANDLSKIHNGEHPAMFISADGIERCTHTKKETADGIREIARDLVMRKFAALKGGKNNNG